MRMLGPSLGLFKSLDNCGQSFRLSLHGSKTWGEGETEAYSDDLSNLLSLFLDPFGFCTDIEG